MKRSLIVIASLVLSFFFSSTADAQYRRNERVVIQMKIDSWAPQEGAVGTLVTLQGSGFTRKMQILMGGRNVPIVSIGARSLSFRVPASYGNGAIVLRKSGMASDYQVGTFAVWANPEITGFAPASGTPGTKVEIRGQHFSQGDMVYLGSHPLSVERWSPSSMIVTIPSGATSGYVVVENQRGPQARSPRSFTVVAPAPYISSFSPTKGQPGSIVRINGGNYDRDIRVSYGRQAVPITRSGPNWLEIAIPSNADRSWPISIASRRGSATSATAFELELAPSVDSYAPAWGHVGTRVTLRGNNFSAGDRVSLAGQNCKIFSLRGNQLIVEIPPGARSGLFTVHHGSQSVSFPSTFDVLYKPQLTSVTPLAGAAGTEVRVRGHHLDASRVFLGNLEIQPSSIRDHEIVFVVPSQATSASLRVLSRGGEDLWAQPFEVWNYPSISAVRPARGPVGSSVTIEGNMLSNATQFFLGPVEMPIIARQRDGSVVVQVPPGARDGRISWTAYAKNNPTTWRYDVLQAPLVTGYTPAEGAAGTRVSIAGSGFDAASEVFYGSTPVRIWQWSPSRLSIEIPSNATRSEYLTVRSAGGDTRTHIPFALMSVPSITRFSTYSAKPGAELFLWGESLDRDTIVSFGRHETRVLRVNPDKSIVVAVPAIASGTYQIGAKFRGQGTFSRKRFQVESWAQVTGIAPSRAKVGDTILLTGSGLADAQVWFGNIHFPVRRADRRGRKLWVQVPPGCSGTSVLTVVDGSNTSTTTMSLTIDSPPPAPPPKVRDHRTKKKPGKGPKVRDHRRR